MDEISLSTIQALERIPLEQLIETYIKMSVEVIKEMQNRNDPEFLRSLKYAKSQMTREGIYINNTKIFVHTNRSVCSMQPVCDATMHGCRSDRSHGGLARLRISDGSVNKNTKTTGCRYHPATTIHRRTEIHSPPSPHLIEIRTSSPSLSFGVINSRTKHNYICSLFKADFTYHTI